MSPGPAEPLEAAERAVLKIHYNGTHRSGGVQCLSSLAGAGNKSNIRASHAAEQLQCRVPATTKLGLAAAQTTFVPLRAAMPGCGGTIPQTLVVVQRVYPTLIQDRLGSGVTKNFTPKAYSRAQVTPHVFVLGYNFKTSLSAWTLSVVIEEEVILCPCSSPPAGGMLQSQLEVKQRAVEDYVDGVLRAEEAARCQKLVNRRKSHGIRVLDPEAVYAAHVARGGAPEELHESLGTQDSADAGALRRCVVSLGLGCSLLGPVGMLAKLPWCAGSWHNGATSFSSAGRSCWLLASRRTG